MSSYLVVQLYCTPAQAQAVRTALAAELMESPEFARARVGLEQKSESDYEMHSTWAEEHPGQGPSDRAYFLVEMTSPVDVPEPILRKAEYEIIEWIEKTYNDEDNDIAEVRWGSYAGTGEHA
ncbi:hypothetical protein [Nocardia sp. X0981]